MFLRSSLAAARPRTQAAHLFRHPVLQSLVRPRSYASVSHTDALDPRPASRLARYARRSAYTAGAIGLLWLLDTEFNASAVTRNLRTFWAVSVLLLAPSVFLCGEVVRSSRLFR